MSFLPAISGWYRPPTGPRATLHICRMGRALDRRCLTFVLSRELIEQLGWQGGERVVVSLGVGEDLGGFQITRVDKARAGLKLRSHSNARGFRIGITLPPEIHGIRPANFLDHVELPAVLDFSVSEGALELRIPDLHTAASANKNQVQRVPFAAVAAKRTLHSLDC